MKRARAPMPRAACVGLGVVALLGGLLFGRTVGAADSAPMRQATVLPANPTPLMRPQAQASSWYGGTTSTYAWNGASTSAPPVRVSIRSAAPTGAPPAPAARQAELVRVIDAESVMVAPPVPLYRASAPQPAKVLAVFQAAPVIPAVPVESDTDPARDE